LIGIFIIRPEENIQGETEKPQEARGITLKSGDEALKDREGAPFLVTSSRLIGLQRWKAGQYGVFAIFGDVELGFVKVQG
jgi:hypothetical protein